VARQPGAGKDELLDDLAGALCFFVIGLLPTTSSALPPLPGWPVQVQWAIGRDNRETKREVRSGGLIIPLASGQAFLPGLGPGAARDGA